MLIIIAAVWGGLQLAYWPYADRVANQLQALVIAFFRLVRMLLVMYMVLIIAEVILSWVGGGLASPLHSIHRSFGSEWIWRLHKTVAQNLMPINQRG